MSWLFLGATVRLATGPFGHSGVPLASPSQADDCVRTSSFWPHFIGGKNSQRRNNRVLQGEPVYCIGLDWPAGHKICHHQENSAKLGTLLLVIFSVKSFRIIHTLFFAISGPKRIEELSPSEEVFLCYCFGKFYIKTTLAGCFFLYCAKMA